MTEVRGLYEQGWDRFVGIVGLRGLVYESHRDYRMLLQTFELKPQVFRGIGPEIKMKSV